MKASNALGSYCISLSLASSRRHAAHDSAETAYNLRPTQKPLELIQLSMASIACTGSQELVQEEAIDLYTVLCGHSTAKYISHSKTSSKAADIRKAPTFAISLCRHVPAMQQVKGASLERSAIGSVQLQSKRSAGDSNLLQSCAWGDQRTA